MDFNGAYHYQGLFWPYLGACPALPGFVFVLGWCDFGFLGERYELDMVVIKLTKIVACVSHSQS